MSAKASIKRSLVRSGALKWAARLRPQGAAVLMYHSVLENPDEQWLVLGGIGHSAKVFRKQMEVVARRYRPVSMDDLLGFVSQGKHLPPRAVVVTFDDGYADNLEVAVPILNDLGIPAMFYITVDCIDNRRVPWPSRLRYAFFSTKESSWKRGADSRCTISDTESRNRAYLQACDDCAKLAGQEQERFVAEIETKLNAAIPAQNNNQMMTWDQVRAMRTKGHSIGSHTMTHPNMAYVSTEDSRRELLLSKQRLETELKEPIVHFSYPCPALSPHWNSETLAMSKQAGYRTAVTTDGGMVTQHDQPLSLHRMRPSKDVDELLWNLDCTFLGRAM